MICTLCETHELPYGSLCPHCTSATHERLQRLPRMWASLDAWLAPGTTGSPQYGGRVRRAEAPLPVNSEALDLYAAGGIAGVLEDWREAVYDARGWPPPTRANGLAHRVAIAATDLNSHLDWIARWYAGADFGRDIRRLVDRVRQVVQPGRGLDEPTLLGRCIAAYPDGRVCGHPLYADMSKPVQCDWCLCQYPPDTWLALRHYQPDRGRSDAAGEPEAAGDQAAEPMAA
ncbi:MULTISPECIES: hypothetical protein [Streptomyces]|uniref:hypothetical protein n=1 Tax=Streptomyces TaxID=1883 RepID=UPI00073DECF9|nr:hypothetical protein [Streptomyces sp. FBKL.4005]MYU28630.1 hypothetical protein [Streptomyces sp. SID7810]OYP17030.1 hypothetical protein CFC35_23060 [Streptomyces sp. FBKL.4005]CUW29669.1 hypothetical protein TUE45_04378 [Streptomyces reticuli]